MNENWFDENKKKFDHFIKNSTASELKQALNNADFKTYNKIKVPILDLHDDPNSFVIKYRDSSPPESQPLIRHFNKIKKATGAFAFNIPA